VEPEKTPRERVEDLIRLLVPDWRPTTQQDLWAIRIGIVLGLLVTIGYSYGVTLWDWIKLLIIPAAIAGAGLWFNTQQREREREREQRIADNRAQDDSLQAYLDGMSQLLTDKDQPLRSAQPGDSRSTLARARTLTVLPRLDGDRKRSVLQFLYESDVISRDTRVINLAEADLRGAKLYYSIWTYIDLSGSDLSGSDLSGSDLSGTILHGSNLRGTDLRNADFSAARGITAEELEQQTDLLEGATMPDGSKHL
jgi:hypothetical protein